MVYKELQKKTYPSFRPKIFTPPNQHIQTSNIQQGVTYAQITKPKSFAPPPQTGDELCNNPSPTPLPPLQHSQQSNDIQELKTMIKGLLEQM
jgi:hypothetical protein